jgi:hypothetical protein
MRNCEDEPSKYFAPGIKGQYRVVFMNDVVE